MQVILGTTKPERIADYCKVCNIELTKPEWYQLLLGSKGKEPPLKSCGLLCFFGVANNPSVATRSAVIKNYWNAQLYCPAKINLHLQVGQLFRQREKVFHKVCTLLQAVYLQSGNDLLQMHLSSQSVAKVSEVQILLQVQPQDPLQTRRKLSLSGGKSLPKYS